MAAVRIAEPFGDAVRVRLDERDNVSPGWKFNEWELKGVPIRIELGPKDLQAGQAVVVRRDTGEKVSMAQQDIPLRVPAMLKEIQESLLEKARRRLQEGRRPVDSYHEFRDLIEGPGGFLYAPWCGSAECEARISEETKATIRVIPDDAEPCPACMVCGKGPAQRVPFARAY